MENQEDTRIQDVEEAWQAAIEEYAMRVTVILSSDSRLVRILASTYVMQGMTYADEAFINGVREQISDLINTPDTIKLVELLTRKAAGACKCPTCVAKHEAVDGTDEYVVFDISNAATLEDVMNALNAQIMKTSDK